jgi:hypothetical protein
MYAEKRFEVIAPQKHEPSLDGFIDWLKTKPVRGRYKFDDRCGACLLGQYMAHCGIAWVTDGPRLTSYCDTADAVFPCDGSLHVLFDGAWTYGAALKRAQAYRAGHFL